MATSDEQVTFPPQIGTSGSSAQPAMGDITPVCRSTRGRVRETASTSPLPRSRDSANGEAGLRALRVKYGFDKLFLAEQETVLSALCATTEPANMTKAKQCSDANKWLAAAKEEMKSLEDHKTRTLTKNYLLVVKW